MCGTSIVSRPQNCSQLFNYYLLFKIKPIYLHTIILYIRVYMYARAILQIAEFRLADKSYVDTSGPFYKLGLL